MPSDDLTTVKRLFELAHITMSEEEYDQFARNYATLRAQADALYREDLRQEAPALAFDPLHEYA
jgi:Asp-tRNA(Asn)/Glu-tRNA(Gln) amidotransferase C subunit